MRSGRWQAIGLAMAVATFGAAAAEVTLFQFDNFSGERLEVGGALDNLQRQAFNDSANSAIIERGSWQLCEHAAFQGACVTLGPGRYASLRQIGLDNRVSSIRPMQATGPTAGPADRDRSAATFFLHEGFEGDSLNLDGAAPDFRQHNANDKASSLIVRRGHWQVCEDIQFKGRCVVFGPGRYPSMRPFNLNDAISSARPGGNVTQAVGAELILYEHDNFAGRRVASGAELNDLGSLDFARRASSVVIEGGNWQLCSEPDFRGRCVVLGPGRHPSLRQHGLNDAVASVRRSQIAPGVGSPPVFGGPTMDANTACAQAVEARVRDEHPRAERVQVLPQSLWSNADGAGGTAIRGDGEYEVRRDRRRFRFECVADARGARVTRLRYDE